MIVYSVASKQSFEMARVIRDKILNHLVGTAVAPTIPHTLTSLSTHRLSTGSPLSS